MADDEVVAEPQETETDPVETDPVADPETPEPDVFNALLEEWQGQVPEPVEADPTAPVPDAPVSRETAPRYQIPDPELPCSRDTYDKLISVAGEDVAGIIAQAMREAEARNRANLVSSGSAWQIAAGREPQLFAKYGDAIRQAVMSQPASVTSNPDLLLVVAQAVWRDKNPGKNLRDMVVDLYGKTRVQPAKETRLPTDPTSRMASPTNATTSAGKPVMTGDSKLDAYRAIGLGDEVAASLRKHEQGRLNR